MSVFDRIRAALFPNTLPDTTERDIRAAQSDSDTAEQTKRAIALMDQWNPERAEDLRRLNRTGNIVEGWLVPDDRKDSQ